MPNKTKIGWTTAQKLTGLLAELKLMQQEELIDPLYLLERVQDLVEILIEREEGGADDARG